MPTSSPSSSTGIAVISDVDDRSGRTRSGTPIPDGFTEYWTFRRTGAPGAAWSSTR
jgi:predicted lipid-binding transport protein (Tim44 family)